jgi:hypothetical protein
MIRKLALASALLAAGLAYAPASAETLNVTGIVAPYCNVSLTNVSSGTASIAMVARQTVANLRLACNSPTGAKMITTAGNGDLLSSRNNRINYALELVSPDPQFAIAETDTKPTSYGGEGISFFTRQNSGYTQALANGIALQLWMNVNVNVDNTVAPTSNNYQATAAPADTYIETFTFTATSV